MKNKKKKSLQKISVESDNFPNFRINKINDYPCRDDYHCFCGGLLWPLIDNNELYYRCSECGNDYSFWHKFINTREQRHENTEIK